MGDLIRRIITHPRDYFGLLKRHKIIFERRLEEHNNITTFIFRPAKPFTWRAGQHALFFPTKEISGKQYRVFSIASASDERIIQISTTIPPEPSPFKQYLLSLRPGDSMRVCDPIGEMYERPSTKQIVAIAGGVGITPFRSLLAAHVCQPDPKAAIHLIHAGKNGHHLYRAEIEKFANDPTVSVSFVMNAEEVNAALDAQLANFHNTAEYYISGSPGMITAITNRLREAGVTRIVSDPFKGY